MMKEINLIKIIVGKLKKIIINLFIFFFMIYLSIIIFNLKYDVTTFMIYS